MVALPWVSYKGHWSAVLLQKPPGNQLVRGSQSAPSRLGKNVLGPGPSPLPGRVYVPWHSSAVALPGKLQFEVRIQGSAPALHQLVREKGNCSAEAASSPAVYSTGDIQDRAPPTPVVQEY